MFFDCDLGNSTMNNEKYAKYTDSPIYIDSSFGSNEQRLGSVFGEGSLTMIVAILALVASVVSICLTISFNKKKYVQADKSKNKEDEE